MRGGFLLWAAAAAGFGGLLPRERRALSDADAPEAPAAFTAAADECRERIGHTLGEVWMQCVVDRLLVAMGDPTSTHPPFATVPHTFDPLAPLPSHAGEAGYASSHRLKDLLRDYSCDASGPGSTPSRRFAWTHTPHDPCAAAEREEAGGGVGGGGGAEGAFLYRRGFLPAGDSLGELDGEMSEAEALSLCASHARCQGFTYASSERAHGRRHRMMFKSAADDVAAAEGWHSFKRRAAAVDCSPPPGASRRPPPPAVEYSVGVLREEPPIYVVDGFVSRAECEAMVNATVPRMGRSVVSGGGFSAARRSYSVNMYPEYDDPNRPVTALARRLFAFAREAAGYETLMEGPGQEPVNAVYYKDDGDQYRAHCDGECNGGPWREGKRIATGLVYCETADRGGDTLFTRVGLKVVPKPGQLLFFGYKLRDEGSPTGWAAAMDNGVTEHSGCPLREGRKWIATMWYREGMTPERGWQQHQH